MTVVMIIVTLVATIGLSLKIKTGICVNKYVHQ